MDLFLSRQEIRRRALAATGYSTDNLLNAQDLNRINGYIDDASLKVAGECRWISMTRRATLPVDEDQTAVSYRDIEQAYWNEKLTPGSYFPWTYKTPADPFAPDMSAYPIANVGPAGIEEIAFWQENYCGYVKLWKGHEYATMSQDRWGKLPTETQYRSQYAGDSPTETQNQVQAAEGVRERNRFQPYSYEPGADSVILWPIPDKRYVLRVVYNVTPTWMYNEQAMNTTQIDQMPSLVDATAIIYAVCADIYGQQGDDYQGSRYCDDQRRTGKFWDRIRALMGRQNTGESICADDTARFDSDPYRDRNIPNWDDGPRGPQYNTYIQ